MSEPIDEDVALRLMKDNAVLRQENARLQAALETALEYTRHSEGCSSPYGKEYKCRCNWEHYEKEVRAALSTTKYEREVKP